MNQEYVRIFDTTLRDGEQAAGVSLSREEKLQIARQLAALRVDVIEAGFPAASPGDLDAVAAIAAEVRTSTVAGLARAHRGDIEAAGRALRHAAGRSGFWGRMCSMVYSSTDTRSLRPWFSSRRRQVLRLRRW